MYGPHALIAFAGDWATSDGTGEVWQFGLRVVEGTPGGFLCDPQGFCDALAGTASTGVRSWFALAANGMSTNARLRLLKVNNINPDGTYHEPLTHLHDYGAGITGGSAQTMDGICSLAYTWETNVVSRGPGSRGRIYPPNPTYGLNGAFTVTT